MARLSRLPTSVLLAVLLGAGGISVPLISIHLPTWARIALLSVAAALVLAVIVARLCPAVDVPGNVDHLLRNRARQQRSYALLEKRLALTVSESGGNRRDGLFTWTYIIKSLAKQPLRQIEAPLLGEVPLSHGDLRVRVSVGDEQNWYAVVTVVDRQSPIVTLPLPYRGLFPSETLTLRFSYEWDAVARLDADSWILDLSAIVSGGRAELVLRYPRDVPQHATGYVIRQRGFCRRRVPLGLLDTKTEESHCTVMLEYMKHSRDSYLVVDTNLANLAG